MLIEISGLHVRIFQLLIVNSKDPDEMPHFTTFHQGLHYLLISNLLQQGVNGSSETKKCKN